MSEVTASIESANEHFMGLFNKGDLEGMAQCYTMAGQLLPPGGDIVIGPRPIEAFWRAVKEMGIATVKLQTNEVDDHGDTAIEIGSYELGTADGSVADKGKYLVVWRNQRGAWKLHRDIWNTSLSPAAE